MELGLELCYTGLELKVFVEKRKEKDSLKIKLCLFTSKSAKRRRDKEKGKKKKRSEKKKKENMRSKNSRKTRDKEIVPRKPHSNYSLSSTSKLSPAVAKTNCHISRQMGIIQRHTFADSKHSVKYSAGKIVTLSCYSKLTNRTCHSNFPDLKAALLRRLKGTVET
ncbi:hypothetical protein PoB_000372400 [Plakobranchus ocellatus]|uniref:Uncharacterized protein n=1 Tax=Plakobranchus ocellatus TaxID=259542 RepID=A0AAV3Y2L8_9GAST|nr:hypothetical protein PoB_000372400 [Plakobranchus ocellatus]